MVRKEGEDHRKRRLDSILERAKRPGHVMTELQRAMLIAFASIDPKFSEPHAAQLDAIKKAVERDGQWRERREWRISTGFDSSIIRTRSTEKPQYQARVECDGQALECGCPTIEKAFAFVMFYETLIVDQFYSVGPPWADRGLPWSE